MILGIDEVGRGSWAGPLVVGAVVLGGNKINGLTDSKKLTSKKRLSLDATIRNSAKSIGLGWVSASELDEIGLIDSLKLASIRAVGQIKADYNEIIIDGNINFLTNTVYDKHLTLLKKADVLISAVSAASIVAKVARDNYMINLPSQYHKFYFASNFGYGTNQHRVALKSYGISDQHRKSYAPISRIVKDYRLSPTSRLGIEAQNITVAFLVSIGHSLLVCNWQTKYCEIDIVSNFNDITYFTEVRYRKSDTYGSGVESINNQKLKQMKKAAEIYSAVNNVDNYILAVASVSNSPMELDSWVEIV